MIKKMILSVVYILIAKSLFSQQHNSSFIPEFQKVYEKLIARQPNGTIIIPGLNNKGSIMLMAVDRRGATIWAKNLSYGYELLDFCLDENSNYLLLIKEKNKVPDNEFILLGLNGNNLVTTINKKIVYDSVISFDIATLIHQRGDDVEIIATDTNVKKMVVFHYNNIDSLVKTIEFKVPYTDVKISTLDVFGAINNRIAVVENNAKIGLNIRIKDNKVSFYRTDYGFFGVNTRHTNVNGVTGFVDQRQNIYDRWVPVRLEDRSTYRSKGIPSIKCTDRVSISAAMGFDSIISYAYAVDSDTNGSKKFIRFHTFSYDMQILSSLNLYVKNDMNLRTVFHQPYEAGIIFYMIFNEGENDLVCEYKLDSAELKSQELSCFSMQENDSLKTYDMITPWSHSTVEATLTNKWISNKTISFPPLRPQRISREPYCEITIDKAKESFKSYPNPFHNEIELEYELKDNTEVEFLFYDIQGRIVYKTKPLPIKSGLNTTQLDLRELSFGVYYVVMIGNNVRKTTVVVKR